MIADAPIWMYMALSVAIAACALRLTIVDIKKLEIELETLAVMALIAGTQAIVWQDPLEVAVRLFAGVSFWGCLVLSSMRFAGLARFGAGDPPLIGVLAFLVAPHVLAWAVLSGALMMATCAWYSHQRGKRLFKSMYPAAPPMIAAAMIVFILMAP